MLYKIVNNNNNNNNNNNLLLFKFNIGNIPVSKDKQYWLLSIMYNDQKVFSLHDEDLTFCTKLVYTILTTPYKPVYLFHRMIPHHLHEEVRQFFDAWLRHGVIRPLKSPYASHILIMRKKTAEIQLCVNLQKIIFNRG